VRPAVVRTAEHASEHLMYEVDFLPVGMGNGDAICVRYGNEQTGYYLHVIDGGFKNTAEAIIAHIETHYGKHYYIHHMVVSHADNDHAAGLIDVLKRFDVKVLWMNRPWLFVDHIIQNFHGNFARDGLIKQIRERHSYLVELENLAAEKGTIIRDVFQGDQIGPFTVLAPSRERYITLLPDLDKTPASYAVAADAQRGFFSGLLEKAKQWFDENWDIETLSHDPEPTSASNEACVVQLGEIEGKRILLTADAGPAALNEAADYAQTRGLLKPPNFVQVPHHGSRRNVTPAVLDRLLGPKMGNGQSYGIAYCSVGDSQTDYPRGQVKNAFLRRGYPVHVTRGATKTHYYGRDLRPGWIASTPEPLEPKVDG
jgi:beta-lactamase superfamily II metal-dependent hydrolase